MSMRTPGTAMPVEPSLEAKGAVERQRVRKHFLLLIENTIWVPSPLPNESLTWNNSSSQLSRDIMSFLVHGSRNYHSSLPRDRSNLFTFFFLPPLKFANDGKENPAALRGVRDKKGRESHPSRVSTIADITESDALVSTPRRCSYRNVIYARMGYCTDGPSRLARLSFHYFDHLCESHLGPSDLREDACQWVKRGTRNLAEVVGLSCQSPIGMRNCTRRSDINANIWMYEISLRPDIGISRWHEGHRWEEEDACGLPPQMLSSNSLNITSFLVHELGQRTFFLVLLARLFPAETVLMVVQRSTSTSTLKLKSPHLRFFHLNRMSSTRRSIPGGEMRNQS
ncbi:hypothetical protein EV421DRAFT_1742431 [Armillaria borealis]|uniref:Uncharacterized protein n=1 Tax=Armillaria borealis TaxID=47425 RepID=A0AA39MFD5_9AGAR|nr:hypothetical protein EV421DRAFT_1742431 [Armillaria borealis]